MTRAYVIAQAAVTNPEQYEGYKALAGAAVAKYGGKYIVRGGATHLLEGGAELTTVRDNLRHTSLATTSMYLHTDDARRAKQVADRFAAPRS